MNVVDRWRRAAPVLGVALLVVGWSATGPAVAQEDAPDRVVLRAVDAVDQAEIDVVVSWSGDPGAVEDATVVENGQEVDAEIVDLTVAGFRTDLVVVFDTSGSTEANALVATAREAVAELFDELPPRVRASVVTAGGATQTVQNLTEDRALLADAVENLTAGGDGALLSGVVRAASAAGRPGTVPTVLLITDGVNDSATSSETTRATLFAEGVSLYVVGLQDGDLDEGAFSGLANGSGGRMLVTPEATQIPDLVEQLTPELVSPQGLRFSSDTDQGVQDIAVTIEGTTVEGSYVSGSTLIGARRLVLRDSVEPGGIAFFQSDLGRWIGLGAAGLACIMFAYGIILLFVREQTTLNQALQPYADGYVAGGDDDDDDNQSFAQTAFLQRAVALTEQLANRQGALGRLEIKLEKADLPLRAGEALFLYLVTAVLVFVGVGALAQNFMAAVVVGLMVVLIPPAVLNFMAALKKKRFEALLPDTLQLLSSTLRAGYSMMQGVEAVSEEVAEPMGKELRRVVTEARLGRQLEESLDAVAERMGSPDFAWAVMAIRIQREVGGNLSELLMTVAETMTQRERLRRDVNSLTAEGRISAYVLIALPIGIGGFLWVINREYIGTLFDETVGQVMLASAVVMMIVGYLWMMKIIKIEI